MISNKIEEISKLTKDTYKSNIINEFLWSCAGVNKEIIRQCPNEYSKYAGVGGTILFTALMAMISGGYAMFFVFKSKIISMLFAIFWGMLIFNLDRFIVNSMYIDDSPYLNWNKLRAAMPRFIMAIFLGLVISTPLEMKIFNDKIESQLITDNIVRANDTKDTSNDYKELNELESQYQTLLDQRKNLSDNLQIAQKELKDEGEGNALSGKVGHGPIYEDKEKYMIQCTEALNQWDILNQHTLENLKIRINALTTNINKIEQTVNETYDDGFIARYEAYSNLKKGNTTLSMISFMITLLFIIIEIIPTFFKLVMEHGLYDQLCDTQDEIQKKISIAKKDTILDTLKSIQVNSEDLIRQQNELQKERLFNMQQKHILELNQNTLLEKKKALEEKNEELEKSLNEVSKKDEEIEQLQKKIVEIQKENMQLQYKNNLLDRTNGKKLRKRRY